jgi:hypothetical protein
MNAPPRSRRRRPPAASVTPLTPIWCPGCSRTRPARDFNRETRRFSGLSGRCRECQAAERREPASRARTKERNRRRWAKADYRAKSTEWQRQRRERLGTTHDLTKARHRLQAIVRAWKSAHPCEDCGYADIRALDADHRDPESKVAAVARLVQLTCSEERLRDELAKCESRCARCHRLRTQSQRPNAQADGRRLPPSWQRRIDHQVRNDAIKLARGCDDCGWRAHPRGLDWDHAGFKGADVARLMAQARPWEEIEAEIALCDLRCANCHRIRTLERLG